MSSRAVGSKVTVRRGGGGWPYVVVGFDMMAGSASCSQRLHKTNADNTFAPGGRQKSCMFDKKLTFVTRLPVNPRLFPRIPCPRGPTSLPTTIVPSSLTSAHQPESLEGFAISHRQAEAGRGSPTSSGRRPPTFPARLILQVHLYPR